MLIPLIVNCIVPVAVFGDTVAVNVTGWLTVDGFKDDVMGIVVLLVEFPMIVLLGILCDDVWLLGDVTALEFVVELFIVEDVLLKLLEGGSIEKAYCGRIKIIENNRGIRIFVFMPLYRLDLTNKTIATL